MRDSVGTGPILGSTVRTCLTAEALAPAGLVNGQNVDSALLPKRDVLLVLSDMRTVTLRSLRRDTDILAAAAKGEELLVTRFAKPYVRIVAANHPRSFVGAGKYLAVKKPVAP